jgi:hypothetical protein
MTSLKEDIIRFLAHNPDWHTKAELLNREWKYPDGRTYMSDTVSRKLREAESESRIAVKDTGVSVSYKFLPVEKRKDYQPWSLRVNKDELFK